MNFRPHLITLFLLLSLGACSKRTTVAGGTSSAGTAEGFGGGDLHAILLDDIRRNVLLPSLRNMKLSGSDFTQWCKFSVPCSDANNALCRMAPVLTSEQEATCRDYLIRNVTQLEERVLSPAIKIVPVMDPLEVGGTSVSASTSLNDEGDILVSIPRIETLSRIEIAVLLVHEFSHKVLDPLFGYVQDLVPYQSFTMTSGGAVLVTAVGMQVALNAQTLGLDPNYTPTAPVASSTPTPTPVPGSTGPVAAATPTPTPIPVAPAVLVFSKTAHNFGTQLADSITRLNLMVHNPSVTTASGIALVLPSAPFVIESNACQGATLAPNGSCALTVAFRPTVDGDYSHLLTLNFDNGAGGQGSAAASFSGRGRITRLYASVQTVNAPAVIQTYDAQHSTLGGTLVVGTSPLSSDVAARIAVGDVNGDGRSDLIVGAGASESSISNVRVIDGRTGGAFPDGRGNFVPFAGLKDGVFVAAGDINGDGKDDIIVSSGDLVGSSSLIKVYNGNTLAVLHDFVAHPSRFIGGTTVASVDFDGDGKKDIVAGFGRGSEGLVRVFKAGGSSVSSLPLLREFLAPGEERNLRGEYPSSVNVAAGKINGQVRIAVGPSLLGGRRVGLYNSAGQKVQDFDPFPNGPRNYKSGTMLSMGDADGDGSDDIACAPFAGENPIYIYRGSTLDQWGPAITFPNGLTAHRISVSFGQ